MSGMFKGRRRIGALKACRMSCTTENRRGPADEFGDPHPWRLVARGANPDTDAVTAVPVRAAAL